MNCSDNAMACCGRTIFLSRGKHSEVTLRSKAINHTMLSALNKSKA